MIALDDNIEDHPKFAGISNDAFALWVRCVGYCRRNLTDGFVPSPAVLARCRSASPKKAIAELLRVSPGCSNPLWREVDGGYQVHDYLEWNPSRETVEAKLEEAREKGRKGGLRSGVARKSKGSPKPLSPGSDEPEAKQLASPEDEPNTKQAASPLVEQPGSQLVEPKRTPIRSDPIRSGSLSEAASRSGTSQPGEAPGSAAAPSLVQTWASELRANRLTAFLADDDRTIQLLAAKSFDLRLRPEWIRDAVGWASERLEAKSLAGAAGEALNAETTIQALFSAIRGAATKRQNARAGGHQEPARTPPEATDPRVGVDPETGRRTWDVALHGWPPKTVEHAGLQFLNLPDPPRRLPTSEPS